MWHIGQDIVAIVNHPQGDFKEGDLRTVKALKETTCKCGGIVIHTGKFAAHDSWQTCGKCKFEGHDVPQGAPIFYHERSFRELDEMCNISELTEVLDKEAFSV